jgi:hypothetical protein
MISNNRKARVSSLQFNSQIPNFGLQCAQNVGTTITFCTLSEECIIREMLRHLLFNRALNQRAALPGSNVLCKVTV